MILVIGGTGNIGSEVVSLLTKKGSEFRVLARDPDKTKLALGDNVDVVPGDLRNPQTIIKPMQNVEKVFLVTPLATDQVEMRNTVIDAAKEAGVQHVVMSTGIGAAPDALVKFGQWHGQNQEHLKGTGMAWTFVQPSFFMQNFLMMADSIRRQGAFYLPLAENSLISWVDARDIAAVAATALTCPGHDGKAYAITGPEAITCERIAEIMSETLGKEIRYIPVSLDDAKIGMMQAGMPEVLANAMNELYALGPAGYLGGIADTVPVVTGNPGRTFSQFVADYGSAFA